MSSSWLGIAERAGMVATAQLLFLLARHTADVLGADAAPWWTPPDRVVAAVATRLGHSRDRDQTRAAMAWVKSRAYRTGRAVVDGTAFAGCLDGLTHQAAGGARCAPTPMPPQREAPWTWTVPGRPWAGARPWSCRTPRPSPTSSPPPRRGP
ncbi:hypothetical protein OG311_03310 [Streptomyces sp. NBC_01343]|uniref:hypothetical protein n=1 Tax=Streptomyces sp. NBC_01343 TaxID=2903832 RepID=UPI002E0F7A06|nr:hypothetical protein OG311_03310 [Streptomyces sp. NBC_01343]